VAIAAKRGFLAELLFLHLDNTVGENKTDAVIGAAGWYVERRHFNRVIIFCCPVGHTFTDLDQSFSTLIRGLFGVAVYTMDMLLKVCARVMMHAKRRYNFQGIQELDGLYNWTAFVTEHMHPLGGYATGQQGSGMHLIIITRDAEGHARVKFSQSSQSSTFFPESGEGYRLFKWDKPPEGPPPLAGIKKDADWEKEAVIGTVRRWYHYFVFDSAEELQRAKNDWETRFSTVPSLPPWVELPVCCGDVPTRVPSVGTGCTFKTAAAAASFDLQAENPPVNPIISEERTHAMVRDELEVRHDAERTATGGSLPPVYRSDYIFVRLEASGPLELCQVPRSSMYVPMSSCLLMFTCFHS